MKFGFSLDKSLIYQMAQQAGMVTEANMKAAQDAVKDVALMAEAQARILAAKKLYTTRQKYEDNLSMTSKGDDQFELRLKGEAAYLEEGYSSFDMIKAGLARGPKSRLSKEGYHYAYIPFEHKEAAAKKDHPLSQRLVQIGQTTQTTQGNLAADLKFLKQKFGLQGLTRGPTGNVPTGNVARIDKSPDSNQWTMKSAFKSTQTINENRNVSPLLSGLSKVQYETGSKMKAAYMTWRTATENPNRKAQWRHPGFKGAQIFPELEQWIVDEVSKRLQDIFKR